MAAATLTHDALLPRPPGGLAPGAAMALLAHAGLLLALTYATDWRTQAPEVVSAELWAAVPQVAAPPPEPVTAPPPTPAAEPKPPTPSPAPAPVAPTPPARDADIATERAEKRKAEAEQKLRAEEARKARELKAQTERQAEATRQQKAEADRVAKAEQKRLEAARESARELLADEARLAELREANLRRMMGQAGPGSPTGTGNPGSRGTAAQDAAPSAAYSGRLAALIRSNTVFTGNVPDSAVAEVEVRAAASGTVLARRLVKSSGHADWDEAVLRAIDRTGRLPRDADGRVPAVIIIAFKPRE
jgi:colicin import membrane protein